MDGSLTPDVQAPDQGCARDLEMFIAISSFCSGEPKAQEVAWPWGQDWSHFCASLYVYYCCFVPRSSLLIVLGDAKLTAKLMSKKKLTFQRIAEEGALVFVVKCGFSLNGKTSSWKTDWKSWSIEKKKSFFCVKGLESCHSAVFSVSFGLCKQAFEL